MTESLDLNQVRKKALSAEMADGVMELVTGYVITFAGVMKLWQHYGNGDGIGPVWLSTMVIAILFIIRWLKKRVTYPRIGYVNVSGSGRSALSRRMLIGTIAAVLLLLLAIWVRFTTHSAGDESSLSWIKPYVGLFFGGVVAVLYSTKAILRHTPRLHVVSGVVLAVFVAFHLLGIYPGVGVLVTGLGLLLTGTVMMIRFVRSHPVLPADDYEGPENNV